MRRLAPIMTAIVNNMEAIARPFEGRQVLVLAVQTRLLSGPLLYQIVEFIASRPSWFLFHADGVSTHSFFFATFSVELTLSQSPWLELPLSRNSQIAPSNPPRPADLTPARFGSRLRSRPTRVMVHQAGHRSSLARLTSLASRRAHRGHNRGRVRAFAPRSSLYVTDPSHFKGHFVFSASFPILAFTLRACIPYIVDPGHLVLLSLAAQHLLVFKGSRWKVVRGRAAQGQPLICS